MHAVEYYGIYFIFIWIVTRVSVHEQQYGIIWTHTFQLSIAADTEEEEEEETTLEKLLSRVGLQDKVAMFEQEQIDLDALVSFMKG